MLGFFLYRLFWLRSGFSPVLDTVRLIRLFFFFTTDKSLFCFFDAVIAWAEGLRLARNSEKALSNAGDADVPLLIDVTRF